MTERIQTLHPHPGKQGVRIDGRKYMAVRDAILAVIDEQGEAPFSGLAAAVAARLPDFDGSMGWYTTTVKLDLEARQLIERVPGHSPQMLRRRLPTQDGDP